MARPAAGKSKQPNCSGADMLIPTMKTRMDAHAVCEARVARECGVGAFERRHGWVKLAKLVFRITRGPMSEVAGFVHATP